jgi:hypothetical protein
VKRYFSSAVLLAALLGGGAPVPAGALPWQSTEAAGHASAADARTAPVSSLTDTSWGGGCELPLCKPLM